MIKKGFPNTDFAADCVLPFPLFSLKIILMNLIDGSNVGKLFEKAGTEILSALFRQWEYQIKYVKLQAAGTQHGFDIFFRLLKPGGKFPLNIYIECKASSEYKKIPAHELIYKTSQLKWAGFAHKDIHIFFSPTVGLRETNQETGIESNDYPFIVIDWMHKDSGHNKIMELFYAYKGDAEYINKYKDFLSEHFKEDFTSTSSFEEISKELCDDFGNRIEEYYALQENRNFYLFSSSFLENVKSKTKTGCLPDYYTRTDSTPIRILQVIANDFYVPIEGQFDIVDDKACKTGEIHKKSINDIIDDVIGNTPALIKILSRGGEGKSTFLNHIARRYFDKFNVFYLEKLNDEVINGLSETLKRINKNLPVLLLMDNAEKHQDALIEYGGKLVKSLYDYKLIFIPAERDFRYHNIEKIHDFERHFDERHTLNFFTPGEDKNKIFRKLFSYLTTGSGSITERDKTICRELYSDPRASVAESTFNVIKYLKANYKIEYEFDWVDWQDFIKNQPGFSVLENLYMVLATFYQFGVSITDNFYAKGDINVKIKINKALSSGDEGFNLPIYKTGDELFLRHEFIAWWYFEEEKEGKTRQNNAKLIFTEFLEDINDEDSKEVFIHIYRDKEFQNSFLKDLVNFQKAASILENYIKIYPGEIKARTELGKIYQSLADLEKAEKVLKEAIEIDKNHLHSRTQLGKVYQKLGKCDQRRL